MFPQPALTTAVKALTQLGPAAVVYIAAQLYHGQVQVGQQVDMPHQVGVSHQVCSGALSHRSMCVELPCGCISVFL